MAYRAMRLSLCRRKPIGSWPSFSRGWQNGKGHGARRSELCRSESGRVDFFRGVANRCKGPVQQSLRRQLPDPLVRLAPRPFHESSSRVPGPLTRCLAISLAGTTASSSGSRTAFFAIRRDQGPFVSAGQTEHRASIRHDHQSSGLRRDRQNRSGGSGEGLGY